MGPEKIFVAEAKICHCDIKLLTKLSAEHIFEYDDKFHRRPRESGTAMNAFAGLLNFAVRYCACDGSCTAGRCSPPAGALAEGDTARGAV